MTDEDRISIGELIQTIERFRFDQTSRYGAFGGFWSFRICDERVLDIFIFVDRNSKICAAFEVAWHVFSDDNIVPDVIGLDLVNEVIL